MKKILLAFAMLRVIAAAAVAQELTVVTEEWPPYNYEENQEVTGLSTEIVKAALEKAGVAAKFGVYPWARAYKMALENENVLIYTIIRTPEREELFKWVGPLVPSSKFSLYKLKTRADIALQSLADAKRYKIGVMRDDSTYQFLASHGFKDDEQLEIVPSEDLNVKKLFAKRVDFICGNSIGLPERMNFFWLPYEEVEAAIFLFEQGLYIAFSKSTSDELVAKVSKAFEEIKAEGKIEVFMKKYVKDE